MNLREALEDVIESAMIDGWHAMEPETSLWKQNVQHQTHDAITAMREALLSEPVVEAMADHIQLDGEHYYAFKDRNGEIAHDIRAALTAALAAMTEGDTAQEESEHG